jgi:TonB-dependent SusC/RagA subfamily outer membrane receptor
MKKIIITLIILYKSTSGFAQKAVKLIPSTLGEQTLPAVLEMKPQAPMATTIRICSPSRHSIVNPPLFLLDGIEVAHLDSLKIDPKDIASISVLKDRKEVEIYGKKGENGVIIITSKKK